MMPATTLRIDEDAHAGDHDQRRLVCRLRPFTNPPSKVTR
jgi:hypothetical protein